MPFPPTPSNSPSNTPTPSITPSNTPTNTPSSSSCPGSPPSPSPTTTSTPTNTQTPTQTQTGTGGLLISPTPTNTPTNTQTPSSTSTVEYYYYSIRKYDCNNSCAVVPPDLAGRSSVPLSTVDGMYRKIGDYVYQVQTVIDPPPITFDIDLDTATNTDLDCGEACNPTFYYSYTVRLHADNIASTCSSPVVVVFSTSSTFAPGITLYSDDTVPTLLTGYRYVNSFLDGNVYNLDITTGVVGIDTGYDC